jgi:hypothetical protein
MSSQRNGGEERLSSGTGTSRGAAYCTDDGRSEVSARSNSGSATSASSRTESAVADVNVELVEVTSGNSVINEVRDGGRVRASEKVPDLGPPSFASVVGLVGKSRGCRATDVFLIACLFD